MKRTILVLALTLLLSGAAPAQAAAGSDPAESNVNTNNPLAENLTSNSNEPPTAELSALVVTFFAAIAIPNLLKTH